MTSSNICGQADDVSGEFAYLDENVAAGRPAAQG